MVFWAIFLAIMTALRPFLLNFTIDNYLVDAKKETNIIQQYFEEFMQYFFAGNDNPTNLKNIGNHHVYRSCTRRYCSVLLYVFSQLVRQDIIKDLRDKLYHHITSFKMKYFDNEPVGKLVTRSVSDIESIASIFSQGLFMIVSDVKNDYCNSFYAYCKLENHRNCTCNYASYPYCYKFSIEK